MNYSCKTFSSKPFDSDFLSNFPLSKIRYCILCIRTKLEMYFIKYKTLEVLTDAL